VPAPESHNTSTFEVPEIPAIARDFLALADHQPMLSENLSRLSGQYPRFFESLLNILSSDYFSSGKKPESIQQAIVDSGFEAVSRLALVQVIYNVFRQYRISGVDMQAFWQDSLRRAVCSSRLAELRGLDGQQSFCAGFIQDVGLLLLFLRQPTRGLLWKELRKREPEARLSMEQNVFGQQHDAELLRLLQRWDVLSALQQPLAMHHQCNRIEAAARLPLCEILHYADWLSALFCAEDKNFLLNRCRHFLEHEFSLRSAEADALLQGIPEALSKMAEAFAMEIEPEADFSQILASANRRLNQDSQNFQDLTFRLDQALEERDRLAAEINRELGLAREIQQSLLPDVAADDYPIHGINLSARSLSGDFYDVFELENGDIYFNLGDVSGKGVNAALLMAKASSLFRCLGKRIHQPGQLLYEINNELCETSIHGMFVTLVAGLYSPASGEIRLVNAGNPPALLMSAEGICCEYEATAPPLGVLPQTHYTEYNFNLNNGSLYLYSDGVTEGYVDQSTMLGEGGLFKLIATMPENWSAREKLGRICDCFTRQAENLRDDITLLLLEKRD